MDLGTFSYFCMIFSLEKFGLAHQNLLERDLSALLLRMQAVGRQQLSKSIEIALDTEKKGSMNRFELGQCHC